MRSFFGIVGAEWRKQHRIYFHSQVIYFSMLVWPALQFTAAYYAFKPFLADDQQRDRLATLLGTDALTFILTGFLAYTFFFSLVQASWRNAGLEKSSGTLELLFLSPVNRFALLVGQSSGALLESVWLFLSFSLGIFTLTTGWPAHPVLLLVALLALTVASVAWGTLLTSLMFFIRDAGFLYTILDEPMRLFAGVSIPVGLLPIWGRMIAGVFPLTFALGLLRGALAPDASWAALAPGLGMTLGLSGLMCLLGWCLMRHGERRAKQTGTLGLF